MSRTAIGLCQRRFGGDPAKSFFLYDGACFTDQAGIFTADLALSLDVLYHLTEDAVFETYLTHLFAAASELVVIYSTNMELGGTAPHVRHRRFTPWVEANCPDWSLAEVTRGLSTEHGPGRLLPLRALVTSEAVLPQRDRRKTVGDAGSRRAARSLLLAPSRGLGGGIERYVQTVQSAFDDAGVASLRLDLARPGPAGHRALLAEGTAALAGHDRAASGWSSRTGPCSRSRPCSPGRARSTASRSICHGSEVWGPRRAPARGSRAG